jgi:hypothetical protein
MLVMNRTRAEGDMDMGIPDAVSQPEPPIGKSDWKQPGISEITHLPKASPGKQLRM